MSFINDESVVRVKLTNKGRDLLSRGELTFKKFAVGDSEIDYEFIKNSGLPISETSILRPKDNNPSIVSFIYKTENTITINDLPSVSTIPATISNSTTERGFFNLNEDENFSIKNDVQYIKQFDCKFILADCDGTETINLYKSSSYLVNSVEPVIGDYILVKWASPISSGSTVGDFSIDKNDPYLWYKIEDSTGSLTANNLIVTLDRNLPNYSGATSGSSATEAQVMVFPNSNNRETEGDSVNNYYGKPYITDFIDQATLGFFENSIPVVDVPVWNMHIIHTKEILGIDLNDIKYNNLKSRNYAGFVSYIQNQNKIYDNLGIVHYTNLSPNNHYGESLLESTPVLELPTIMWHKNTSIGLTLSCDITPKYLSGINILYYDLIEDNGNVVGKMFNDLKLFVIEDQELLKAMSYKSNRNWTLPRISGGLNIVKCD